MAARSFVVASVPRDVLSAVFKERGYSPAVAQLSLLSYLHTSAVIKIEVEFRQLGESRRSVVVR